MERCSFLRAMAVAAALQAIAGCGGSDDATPAAPEAQPPAPVVQTVGPAGATVRGPDGVEVVIPAGALAQPTDIGIARRSDGAPAQAPPDNPAASAIYELTPHGLVFQKPVTLRMPMPANAAPAAFMAEVAGGWQLQEVTVRDNVAEWQRNAFSFAMIPAVCAPTDPSDPYPCVHLIGSTAVAATPPSAAVSLMPANTMGSAGAWAVTQAATLRLTLNVRTAPDCQNSRAKLVRWNPLAASPTPQVLFDDVVPLTPAPVPVPPGTALSGGGIAQRGIGSYSVDVPFTHADTLANAAGLHAFRFSFSCNRPNRPVQTGSDLITIVSSIPAPPAPPPQYTIGGSVSGLAAAGLVLRNNGGDDLAIAADGPFTFATTLAAGSAYAVSVRTQPSGQTCTVSQGSGNAAANVTSVAVACVTHPSSWAPPLAVSATGRNAFDPALSAASDGGVTLAWAQYDDAPASQYNLYASRFVGGNWQGAQSIETLDANLAASLSGGVYSPRVAATSPGRSHVVFGFSVQPGSYHTAMTRFDGVGWQSQVIDVGANSNDGDVTLTADGGAALVFYSQYDGARYALRSQVYSAASGQLTEVPIDTSTGSLGGSSSFATGVPIGTTDAMAVWTRDAQSVWASRYSPVNGWSAAAQLQAPTGNSVYPPSLAAAGQNAAASWLVLESGYQLYASRYAGGSWSAPVKLAKFPGEGSVRMNDSERRSTAVGVDAAGNVYVAWAQEDPSSGAIVHVKVRRCAIAQLMTQCESAITLDSRNERAGTPSLVVAPNGEVWVAYDAQDNTTGVATIRVARRSAAGTWDATVSVGDAASTTEAPALAVDGQNRVSIAWRGDDRRIYVTRQQ